MKKTKLLAIAALGMTVSLSFTGCFKGMVLDGDGMINSEPVVVESGSEVSSDVSIDWQKPDSGKDTGKEVSEASVTVSGESVEYDGKILFRAYSPAAVVTESSNIFGVFDKYGYPYGGTKLMTYDYNNHAKEAEFFCQDNGFGTMFLNGNMIYSQLANEYNPNLVFNNSVYRRDLTKADSEEIICKGVMNSMSPDGKHFVVSAYETEPSYISYYSVYSTDQIDKPLFQYSEGDSQHAICLGITNDNVFFLEQLQDGSYNLYQYAFDGNYVLLGSIQSDSEHLYYPEYFNDLKVENNKVTFTLHEYQGTGHFYYASTEISCPVYTDEIKETVLDKPFDVEVNSVSYDTDPGYTPNPMADIYDGLELENGNGFTTIIQYYQETPEGCFYEVVDSHRDALRDIGWREAFSYLNMRYLFLYNGESAPITVHSVLDTPGTNGTILENGQDMAHSVYALAKFVGEPGKSITGFLYEQFDTNGPEEPISEKSPLIFGATLSDNFVYDEPDDYNFEKFTLRDLDYLIENTSDAKEIYVKSFPANYDRNGFEADPDDFTLYNSFNAHIGFDEEGKICYLRPIIWD